MTADELAQAVAELGGAELGEDGPEQLGVLDRARDFRQTGRRGHGAEVWTSREQRQRRALSTSCEVGTRERADDRLARQLSQQLGHTLEHPDVGPGAG